MKKYSFYLLLAFLGLFLVNCTEDIEFDPSLDNVQEFVFLPETEFSANESGNSSDETAIEIQAEMLAFEPRDVDVIVSLEIVENGAVEGIDYEVVSASSQIVIPAGSLTSTTGFRIKTVDNGIQASDDRIVTVRITSSSDERLNIGRGIEEPTNAEASISIADDECPDTIDKFDGATWAFFGTSTGSYDPPTGTFTTDISGNTITVVGNLFGFGPSITLEATLEPNGAGATTGAFGFVSTSEEAFSDGYTYRWILNEGTYDVCANSITLESTIQYIDIYGPDPTAWVDWFDSDISATVESFGNAGGGTCVTSNLDGLSASATSSFSNYNDEYPADDNVQMYSDLLLAVNDDCSVLTIAGDFIALGQYFPIEVELNLLADENDPNIGTVSVPTQFVGNDGYGFDYRVRSTGAPGSYNLSDGTLNIDMFIDYDNNGAGYVNWYTGSIALSFASTDPGGGGTCEPKSSWDEATADVSSNFTGVNDEYPNGPGGSNTGTGLLLSVNDDCTELTVTGDFLGLGGYFSVEVSFSITSNPSDQNTGTIAVPTQFIGNDGYGFDYRVRSTGTPGSYNIADGTIDVTLFVDYDNNGAGFINWYTSTSSFTIN